MHSRLRLSSSVSLLLLVGLSARLAAQTPAVKAPEQVVQLTTFVVTGSNIPTAADAVAVPVVVLGSHAIELSGLNANMLEILRKDIPAFSFGGT